MLILLSATFATDVVLRSQTLLPRVNLVMPALEKENLRVFSVGSDSQEKK